MLTRPILDLLDPHDAAFFKWECCEVRWVVFTRNSTAHAAVIRANTMLHNNARVIRVHSLDELNAPGPRRYIPELLTFTLVDASDWNSLDVSQAEQVVRHIWAAALQWPTDAADRMDDELVDVVSLLTGFPAHQARRIVRELEVRRDAE